MIPVPSICARFESSPTDIIHFGLPVPGIHNGSQAIARNRTIQLQLIFIFLVLLFSVPAHAALEWGGAGETHFIDVTRSQQGRCKPPGANAVCSYWGNGADEYADLGPSYLCWHNGNGNQEYQKRFCFAAGPSQSENGEPEQNQCAGNPVNLGTGNNYLHEEDILPVGSGPLHWARHYNSALAQSPIDARLGSGWTHTYFRHLELPLDADDLAADDPSNNIIQTQIAVLQRPDGKRLRFFRPEPHEQSEYVADAESVDSVSLPIVGTDQYPLARTETGWKFQGVDGQTEYYDETGRLQRIVNRSGFSTYLEYDGANRLAKVRDDFDRIIELQYDGNGRLSRVLDPSGNDYRYSHDSQGRLSAVTDPTGAVRGYHYGESGAPADYLTGVTDENGHRYATWEYDARGRAIVSEHAGGAERVEIEYLSDDSVRVTDVKGGTRVHSLSRHRGRVDVTRILNSGCSACGNTTDWEYNDLGLPTREIDRNGNVTTYQYDAHGLEVSRTEAAGTPQARTITTEWNTELRLPLTVTEPGLRTEYTYDARGRRLSMTETDMPTGRERTTTWRYHPDSGGVPGQLAEVDGPRTDVDDITRYEYDTQGNRARVIDALGHVTEITSHDAYGRPLTLVDPNGLTTNLTYEARGRLRSRDVDGEVTAFGYDGVGNLTTISLPDGSELHYEYDAAQRLDAIADEDGNRIDYTLDAAGNRVEQDVRDETGLLVRTQQQVFNELDRLIQTIGAQGQITNHTYDDNGNRLSTTDPAGDASHVAFDALDRVTQVTDPMGGVTSYNYDERDRITSVTDPDGNTTTYTWDGLGNRARVDSPDSGIMTFEHDAAGNIIAKTDAKGQRTQYTYDALNRMIHTAYANGAIVDYIWDAGANGIGRLSRIDETASGGETHATKWTHDLHGRVIERTRMVNGLTLATRHTYDAAGRRIETVYPSGRVVTYTYDTDEVTGIRVDGEAVLTGADYEPFGPVNGWTWGDGDVHQRSYDLDGRLTRHGLATGSPAGGFRDLDYTADDNIAAITGPNLSRTYGYDGLDRLITANDPDRIDAYAYDANGNRISRTTAGATESYIMDPGSNRLLGVSGFREVSYAYDANGNLVDDGEHSYGYSARNRLTEIDSGDTATYRYNALGQRIYKRSGQAIDYLALAEQAEADAMSLEDEAADLQNQAGSAEQAAAAARQRAADARVEREQAQAERERAVAEAVDHRETAATWQDLADGFADQAGRWRDRIVEPPRNFWQRLLNAIYLPLAEAFEQLADSFAGRAEDQIARAEAAETRAAEARTAIDEAAQRIAAAGQEAESAEQRAETLYAEAASRQQQAADLHARAEEYRRLAEENPVEQTGERFVYGTGGQLLGRYADDGSPIREYVYLGNIPVAVAANDAVYYIHSDHLGTPRAVSQPNGAVVWSWISDAFGDTEPNEDPDGDGETFTLNLRHPGQYVDTETGFYYNHFRYYDPNGGHYITSDPIGLEGGPNPYEYAESNPLRYTDPFGQFAVPAPLPFFPFVPGGGGGINFDAPWLPKWWPDDIPHPDDEPQETFECQVEPEPLDPYDEPPRDSCGALAVGFAQSCIRSGKSRAGCVSKATLFYLVCLAGGGLGDS